MTEFVVHSARGEAVVRTSSEREAYRLQRILGGTIEKRSDASTDEPTLIVRGEVAA